MKSITLKFILLVLAVASLSACGSDSNSGAPANKPKPKSMLAEEPDPMTNKGIGPIKEVKLDPEVDQELAAKGKEVYEKMCTACHKPTEKFIGPAPKGILERRTPEWVMNMILNPEQMVKEDPIAKKLLMEFNGSPMANQHLTEEEARAVLEYFRTL
jgi:mono/diheme cytochrome c family protein